MDWNDSPEQLEFRGAVRALIAERLPARYKHAAAHGGPGERAWETDRKSSDGAARQAAVDWHAALAERGWVAPHWPKEYGGGGMTPMEQFVLNQELASAGAPAVGGSGVAMLGPTLILHGNADKPVPFELTARRAAAGIKQAKVVEYAGASHGLLVTERERVTRDLIAWLAM